MKSPLERRAEKGETARSGFDTGTGTGDGCFLSMTSTDLKIRVYDGYRIRVSVPENTTKMLYGKLYVYCRCRVLRRLPVAALAAAGDERSGGAGGGLAWRFGPLRWVWPARRRQLGRPANGKGDQAKCGRQEQPSSPKCTQEKEEQYAPFHRTLRH